MQIVLLLILLFVAMCQLVLISILSSMSHSLGGLGFIFKEWALQTGIQLPLTTQEMTSEQDYDLMEEMKTWKKDV